MFFHEIKLDLLHKHTKCRDLSLIGDETSEHTFSCTIYKMLYIFYK